VNISFVSISSFRNSVIQYPGKTQSYEKPGLESVRPIKTEKFMFSEKPRICGVFAFKSGKSFHAKSQSLAKQHKVR
jgi:hypothetical protein